MRLNVFSRKEIVPNIDRVCLKSDLSDCDYDCPGHDITLPQALCRFDFPGCSFYDHFLDLVFLFEAAESVILTFLFPCFCGGSASPIRRQYELIVWGSLNELDFSQVSSSGW